MSDKPIREHILLDAAALIVGDREEAYGPPLQSFINIADDWTLELRDKLKPGETITGVDVARMMIRLKLNRSTASPDKLDNWIDMGGYAGCGGEIAQHEKKV